MNHFKCTLPCASRSTESNKEKDIKYNKKKNKLEDYRMLSGECLMSKGRLQCEFGHKKINSLIWMRGHIQSPNKFTCALPPLESKVRVWPLTCDFELGRVDEAEAYSILPGQNLHLVKSGPWYETSWFFLTYWNKGGFWLRLWCVQSSSKSESSSVPPVNSLNSVVIKRQVSLPSSPFGMQVTWRFCHLEQETRSSRMSCNLSFT